MKNIVLATLLALCSTGAAAHTLWVLPSHFVLSSEDSWISVDLSAANMTFVPDRGISPNHLAIVFPDGERHAFAQSYQGRRKSQADHQLTMDGTYRIELAGPARYFTFFQEDGQRRRIAANKQERSAQLPANASEVLTTRSRSRALSYVSVNAPNQTALALSNEGLELKLLTHPADVVATEPVRWQFVLDGKPVADVQVELSREGEQYRDDAGRELLSSDANGYLAFTPQVPGRYVLEASVQLDSTDALADRVRESLTLTFEAALP
ncbi:DUF4198 domain-containing protein [Alkalimonas sp.]|uniref:DUF4198 domain-containing protein n=1 Tax=Alkalimonas sp. TaxID=1872453 RepID=UPI00263B73E9|nr:DUF4198 domain-containing protein [Alkalimonas sp.]MCC5826896.1 DUF4198 domain-containing protein [Alkalimonas sp.]